jgi:hypothetical protein
MPIKLANNASGTLATAISASDTGVALTTGNGAAFPTLGAGDYFYATLTSAGGTQEIAKVTARVGDSLTVVRAQEGTTAQSFAAGARFELRVTAASVRDLVEEYDQAVEISIADAGNYYTSSNVEGALQEIGNKKIANFTGNGSTVAFTLASAPVGENATNVYINGVYQQKNTYSVAGAVLTFSEAPPGTASFGSSIEVNYV